MSTENIRTYDVIVIGAGPVGENVADRTAAAGLSTVIVESELAGGECSYWACEPSKALLRPVLLRADAVHVPGIHPAVKEPLDIEAVLAHRDRMSADWKDDGQAEWIKSVGIDLLRGHGRLAGKREVSVETPDGGTIRLRARHAVAVCTGSRAALPPLPGIESLGPWTSRDATSARKPPGRLVVVGAGVVGVEMATAWQALGSRVTLLARGDGLLPRADTEAVPGVVFTDLEVASVGLTVREAEFTGRAVEVVDHEIGHLAGALQYRPDYRGKARILIDRDRQVVVGATFAGPGVGELLYSATVAITAEVPVDRLWHAVPAFPTISEVWLRLLETRRDS
ncbi:FAD-dependent oxidoreductase [Streptomyces sp. NPDC056227]|uniref:FAD-dependent oxidoreductase n=1 Tax=Streptomyces sp. NPDC056227 TaxID=3345753 RepID=UPI0035E23D8A